jgi:hypothetical protein
MPPAITIRIDTALVELPARHEVCGECAGEGCATCHGERIVRAIDVGACERDPALYRLLQRYWRGVGQ